MDLKDFEAMVLRQRPTEITAEVVAEVRGDSPQHGSAVSPKLAPIPGRPPTGLVVDMFAAEFTVGALTYTRSKPSDERWTLQAADRAEVGRVEV